MSKINVGDTVRYDRAIDDVTNNKWTVVTTPENLFEYMKLGDTFVVESVFETWDQIEIQWGLLAQGLGIDYGPYFPWVKSKAAFAPAACFTVVSAAAQERKPCSCNKRQVVDFGCICGGY
jgi:hypothetical protein